MPEVADGKCKHCEVSRDAVVVGNYVTLCKSCYSKFVNRPSRLAYDNLARVYKALQERAE